LKLNSDVLNRYIHVDIRNFAKDNKKNLFHFLTEDIWFWSFRILSFK